MIRLSPQAQAIDRSLSEIARQISLVSASTPTNAPAAWQLFKVQSCAQAPQFDYPPLPENLPRLEETLTALAIDAVHPPPLRELLEDMRTDLLLQIRMLQHRGGDGYLVGSLEKFGAPDDGLVDLARGLLVALKDRGAGPAPSEAKTVNAEELRRRGAAMVASYEVALNHRGPSVQLCAESPGLIVTNGQLRIPVSLRLTETRARALLAHEVGTHILTYLIALGQPLSILRFGLPGYDELQEGLGVVSEYLAGGLTKQRMRLLAARVLAVAQLVQGQGFVSIYEQLRELGALSHRECFLTAMRVVRAGGMTKDMVYLRGTAALLDYLGDGGELPPLFVGKIALRHIPLMQALSASGALSLPRLLPEVWSPSNPCPRLRALREGLSLVDLIERTLP